MFHPDVSIRISFPPTEIIMKDLLDRTIRAMGVNGITNDDIYVMLRNEGLTDNEAALTYKGAKLILDKRAEESKVRVA